MIKILVFYGLDCGSCSLMESRIKNVLLNHKAITFDHINIRENEDLVKKYQILTIPSVVYLLNDIEVFRTTGIVSEESIKKEIEYLEYKENASNN